MVVIWITLPKG